MHEAKNTQRAVVRIGFDGRVHKTFRGPDAEKRFANEVRVLKYLERRNCPFVPRLLEYDPQTLKIVTTNCGSIVQHISDEKSQQLFEELERYGVRHDDPYPRNITYRPSDGQFCIIDFEFAEILDPDAEDLEQDEVAAPDATPIHYIQWSGCTDRGKVRPNNEDAFLAMLLDKHGIRYLGKTGESHVEDADFIFAVSDGMGGERSGEFASRIAISRITSLLPGKFFLSDLQFAAYSSTILGELFARIHHDMLELGRYDPACRNMGATLTLAWFRRGRVFFGHVGDSRLYYVPAEGAMEQLTMDHTHVGWLRRQGKINEREARYHPRKNVLSQALGAGHQYLKPQFGMVQCQPGDKFLLCTDGVIEGLWDRALEEMVRHPPSNDPDWNHAAHIVRAAVAECGRDNATAVLVGVR
ncbi:MAG: hypothetical protein D6753_08570 [Planctomycetota bacterium]|nr:MAG: hypothetical protein D6753_08570 [Planctomycetota bacterium]